MCFSKHLLYLSKQGHHAMATAGFLAGLTLGAHRAQGDKGVARQEVRPFSAADLAEVTRPGMLSQPKVPGVTLQCKQPT